MKIKLAVILFSMSVFSVNVGIVSADPSGTKTYTEPLILDLDPSTESPAEKQDRENRSNVTDPASADLVARIELRDARTAQETYMIMNDKYLTCKNQECEKLNIFLPANLEIGFTASADGKSYTCYAYQTKYGTTKFLGTQDGPFNEEPINR